jgi:hypothetical protein
LSKTPFVKGVSVNVGFLGAHNWDVSMDVHKLKSASTMIVRGFRAV